MGIQELTLTKEGIEMHFETNHLGHWLLTCLGMPKIIEAANNSPPGSRASSMLRLAYQQSLPCAGATRNDSLQAVERPDYEYLKAWGYADPEQSSYMPLDGYSRSNVANVLFGIGAIGRLFKKYGILMSAVHHGAVKTYLSRHFAVETLQSIKEIVDNGVFTYKSLDAGSSNSLVAALDPRLALGVGETKTVARTGALFLWTAKSRVGPDLWPCQVMRQKSSEGCLRN
ncbi:hypothetical protein HIM_08252 [Hirsutella minnesotensis 3608]|uniref:Uncharacterized protein n=1 Tax=Hirsutella minnesotensis 3608 TaxID=1043627 RepID=A0A0F7ZHB0_9HYPO|nr:hypothetical protein HIM_08252 [Hirsutella minnesotensis 3608]